MNGAAGVLVTLLTAAGGGVFPGASTFEEQATLAASSPPIAAARITAGIDLSRRPSSRDRRRGTPSTHPTRSLRHRPSRLYPSSSPPGTPRGPLCGDRR